MRILAEWGKPLINKLIEDSGIESFRQGITRYLREEKRPQLYTTLAQDLLPICDRLKTDYLKQLEELDSQPQAIEAMKAHEINQLHQKLQEVGNEFAQHIIQEVNSMVTNNDAEFERDFQQLQTEMVNCLDQLLKTFSVAQAYRCATIAHPRNATAPLIAVLVEALYYLANELEDVLVDHVTKLVKQTCQRLDHRIQQTEYYAKLLRLIGNDGGISDNLEKLQADIIHALKSEAKTECDRYVRESPRFYDEGTFSIYQFRQTLQQTSQGYDCQSMVEAEPEIRQLLKLDFEPKVSQTIRRNFRQTINQTLKTQLLPLAQTQAEEIKQKYPLARQVLAANLQAEAEAKIADNSRLQAEIEQEITEYNQAVSGINSGLIKMNLSNYQLPKIAQEKSVDILEETLKNNHFAPEILV